MELLNKRLLNEEIESYFLKKDDKEHFGGRGVQRLLVGRTLIFLIYIKKNPCGCPLNGNITSYLTSSKIL